MAFPHDQDDAGDIKSLRRAIWDDASSKYVGYAGGKTYVNFGYGDAGYNWDNAEGWAPRMTYHGTTEVNQFADGTSNGSVFVNFGSKTGLTNLMRTDASGNNTTGTTGRVIRMVNQRGAAGLEGYTAGFFIGNNEPLTNVQCMTKTTGQWCITWYGRKSTSAGNSGTVRQTVYALGCKYDSTNKAHMNFASAADGGNARTGTSLSNPKTGGTYYHSGKITLSTSWTKYTMHFKFNGDANCNYLALRFDIDDGVSGGDTTCYWDRVTLHPANFGIRESRVDGSSGENKLNDSAFGTYS